MIKPDKTNIYWNLRASRGTVRVVLSIRHDFEMFNTAVEKLNNETDGWELIKGSAIGHGDNRLEANKRIENLIKTYTVFS
jgi:hypothetical protein